MILADLLAFLFEQTQTTMSQLLSNQWIMSLSRRETPSEWSMILNILVMVYFRVDYTPRVSGLYSASIKINDMYLWTDHSFGVMIDPTYASAHHSTHNSNAVAVAGAEQLFDVVLRDRFDNRFSFNWDSRWMQSSWQVRRANSCSKRNRNRKASMVIIKSPTLHLSRDNTKNLWMLRRIWFMIASLSVSRGPLYEMLSRANIDQIHLAPLEHVHQTSVMVWAQGGFLATYYKNQDFSQPVYVNFQYSQHVDQWVAWCVNEGICD